MNIQDKTESKQTSDLAGTKTKIKIVEDKYRHLFNSLGDGIFVHDMNGEILDANIHACRRYGYSYEQFKTMNINDIDTPEQAKHIEKRLQLLLKNEQIIFETVHKDCDHKYFPIEATAKLWEYGGKQVALVISHEITERKIIEKERAKLFNNLKESLDTIKILRGLLPICSLCKKIRDDKGYWKQIDVYIQKHSEAEFTHSMCPECSDGLYGKEGWYIEMKNEKQQKE